MPSCRAASTLAWPAIRPPSSPTSAGVVQPHSLMLAGAASTLAWPAISPPSSPRFSVNEDPSDAPPNAGAEEAAAATGNEPAASSAPASGAPEPDNKWPDGARVMVRNKPKSWSEATIYTRLDAEYWRVQYLSGGTGMFKEGDIRAYDAERDAKRARQPRGGRAKAAGPRAASRSRYAL